MPKEKELEFISLVSDTTFKYLYKNIKTRSWIENIIRKKFNLDLSGYQLVDNESNTGNDIKDYRYDLKFVKDNLTVIIEMNRSDYAFLQSKNYQYLYREAGSMYDTGEKYRDKKTKLILFNHFKNKKVPEMKTGNFIFEDPKYHVRIDDIESFEIYLPNFQKVCYDSDEVDVSLSLFSATSYDEMRKLTNNPEDIEVIKELERLAMNEEFKIHYDQEAVRRKTENSIREESYEKGFSQGMEQGIEQGVEQGKEKKQIEIARSMLKKGFDVHVISECTGLSLEEIK